MDQRWFSEYLLLQPLNLDFDKSIALVKGEPDRIEMKHTTGSASHNLPRFTKTGQNR